MTVASDTSVASIFRPASSPRTETSADRQKEASGSSGMMLDRPHQPQTRADAPAQRPEREPRRDNTPTPRTSESRPAHAPKVAASGGRRQSTQGAAAHASAAKQPGEAKEQAKTEIPGASEATTQDATQTADAISDTAVVQAGAAVATEATGQATVAAETPAVNGAAAPLDNGKATWSLNVPKLSNVTVNIKAPSGQTVYTGSYTMNPGMQDFVWDGKDSSTGAQMPAGNYTIMLTASDTAGQPVTVTPEIQAAVDSADLTKDPPTLSIAGNDYTIDKIKRVERAN